MLYWLRNMRLYHSFSDAEIMAATGMSEADVREALLKWDVRWDWGPNRNPGDPLLVNGGVGRVYGQQQRFPAGQRNQEALVAGGVAGREDQPDHAVAVQVVAVGQVALQELPFQARLVEILANVPARREPVGTDLPLLRTLVDGEHQLQAVGDDDRAEGRTDQPSERGQDREVAPAELVGRPVELPGDQRECDHEPAAQQRGEERRDPPLGRLHDLGRCCLSDHRWEHGS